MHVQVFIQILRSPRAMFANSLVDLDGPLPVFWNFFDRLPLCIGMLRAENARAARHLPVGHMLCQPRQAVLSCHEVFDQGKLPA